MNQKALFTIPYGLYVLTANQDGIHSGCITNTVAQVTSDPLQVSVAVNKANYTCGLIENSGAFTASVISQEASFDLFKRFGFQSGRNVDKFAGFDGWEKNPWGWVITEGTNAWISAAVTQTVDLGTHQLFIAKVTDMEVLTQVPSATYSYYQEHIKPRPAAPKALEGQTVWRCRICGYEYVGEELPADFICPVCKHPASDFEKVTK